MKKILIITLSLTFIMLLLMSNVMFARVFGNGSGCAFYPDECLTGTGGSTGLFYTGQNLGGLIIVGASYFTNSQSNYLEFLNKIEMSDLTGIDYQGFRESLLLSFENLEKATDTYSDIIATADKTPYKPDIIKKLKSFDYVTFQNKNCLNSIIFGWVTDYLKKGNVRGVYIKIHKEMESISTQLTVLKSMIDKDQFPEIATVWRINQMYNELLLFGQYAAQVFYEIKK